MLATSTDLALRSVATAIERRTVDALSLDVFDTVLLRRVARPVDAFGVLGAQLVEDGQVRAFVTPHLFAEVREAAERRARTVKTERGAFPEVTLDEIYAVLPDEMLATDRSALIDAELAVEEALVFPDVDVVELLTSARDAGIPVVFTSETYFSAAQVGRLLGAAGVDARGESIFTSSDQGCGKASGLFDVVLERIGVDASRVLHLGDHEEADVEAARASGLQAVLRPLRTPEFDEVLGREDDVLEGRGAVEVEACERGDGGLTALRARFDSAGAPTDVDAAVAGHWVVGASVLGPVFAGFSDWLVERTHELGVHRLSCLMREGTLLAPLVADAAAARGVAVEAAPLWLSRHVCARAALIECDYGELRIFADRAVPPTVAELAQSLGLAPAELGDLAAHSRSRLDDAELREAVLGRISGDPGLRGRVLDEAATLRTRVIEMLERSRHPDDRGITLVDLGWHATTQRMLVRALRAAGSALPVDGLYLMTTGRLVDASLDGVAADAYLVRAGEPPTSCTTIVRSPEVLEQASSGPEGSVVGIDDAGAPVLAANALPGAQLAEAAATRSGIEAFVARWRRLDPPAGSLSTDAATARLRAILTRFIGRPTHLEARLFGGWLHDDNFGMASVRRLAHSELFADGAYLDETRVAEVDAIWPSAIVARDARSDEDDERLLISLYLDDGTGFSERRAVHRVLHTNERGLSYIQLGVASDGAYRIRLDPMSSPAIVRLDRIALKLTLRDETEPVVLVFPSGRELGEWSTVDCFWFTDTILVGTTRDPSLVLDLDPGLGARVTSVLASIACTRVDIPESAIAVDDGMLLTRRDSALPPGLRASARDLFDGVRNFRNAVAMRLERERRGRR